MTKSHPTTPRVVIVGGGTAGITIAARLSTSHQKTTITLIEPSSKHYYQPLWTLVGAGVYPKEVTQRDEKNYIPPNVNWIQDSVTLFYPDQNQIKTTTGQVINYDYLIVAIGIQINWQAIKGLQENLGTQGICSNYSYEHVDKTWEMIRDFKGGKALFTQPNTPIKCGGAPQKIMYLAEAYFRKTQVRSKSDVIFVSAGTTIFGVDKYRRTLEQIIKTRNIKTMFHHNLTEIDVEKKQAIFKHLQTGESVIMPYDLIHVTPPMGAPDCIKASILADKNGWVEVDKHTLQHKRFENIFSLGDVVGTPNGKTGAAIRKQAKIVVSNLLSLIQGQPLTAHYNGYTSCPLVTDYGKVILAEFDYDNNPVETFPFDQSKERLSMYLLKKYILPQLYWQGMLKGRA